MRNVLHGLHHISGPADWKVDFLCGGDPDFETPLWSFQKNIVNPPDHFDSQTFRFLLPMVNPWQATEKVGLCHCEPRPGSAMARPGERSDEAISGFRRKNEIATLPSVARNDIQGVFPQPGRYHDGGLAARTDSEGGVDSAFRFCIIPVTTRAKNAFPHAPSELPAGARQRAEGTASASPIARSVACGDSVRSRPAGPLSPETRSPSGDESRWHHENPSSC